MTQSIAQDRIMARIVTISQLLPANNADRLELASVDGWQVVVPKHAFTVGQRALFCEIDAAIPWEGHGFQLPKGLESKTKQWNNTRVYVVETAQLRGNLSQGMLFPLEAFPQLSGQPVGVDVSHLVGVTKWEDDIPEDENIIGKFDGLVAMKSTCERIQNLHGVYGELLQQPWVCTEKIDGTSTTLFHDPDTHRMRVFGKNFETSHHPVHDVLNVESLLDEIPPGVAVQGETFGPNIGRKTPQSGFRVFSVYRNGLEVPWREWSSEDSWAAKNTVPVLDMTLGETLEDTVRKVSELTSALFTNQPAEGVVFQHADAVILPSIGRSRFKVISNNYLLGRKVRKHT